MARVAYITIATGNYSIFIDKLLESGLKHLLPDCETDFIIFTDSKEHLASNVARVRFIEQSRMGFPYDTLKRYHLINGIADQLDYDYLFFGNVNLVFNQNITANILPSAEDNHLVGVTHPGFHASRTFEYTYERNPKSKAYVAYGSEGHIYYQGCFFGGRQTDFLKLSSELQRRVDSDLEVGLIALWWDESHLNKYFIENPPKTLHPGYAYADAYDLQQFERYITQLDKRHFGGHETLRYS